MWGEPIKTAGARGDLVEAFSEACVEYLVEGTDVKPSYAEHVTLEVNERLGVFVGLAAEDLSLQEGARDLLDRRSGVAGVESLWALRGLAGRRKGACASRYLPDGCDAVEFEAMCRAFVEGTLRAGCVRGPWGAEVDTRLAVLLCALAAALPLAEPLVFRRMLAVKSRRARRPGPGGA